MLGVLVVCMAVGGVQGAVGWRRSRAAGLWKHCKRVVIRHHGILHHIWVMWVSLPHTSVRNLHTADQVTIIAVVRVITVWLALT